jgi:hypothetical protein
VLWIIFTHYFNVPCIFVLLLFQPTNVQLYITTLSLYITFTPTWFDISVSFSGSFKALCFAKLHKFFKLRLLKLQLHKTVRLKYTKILFGRRWVLQQILREVIISCATIEFLCLHVQSAINMAVSVWILNPERILNIRNDGLTTCCYY